MKPEADKEAGLRIIDAIAADDPYPLPSEEFLRRVSLLDCVREVVERAHSTAYWAMIYRAADKIRVDRAAQLSRGETRWET